MSYASSGEVCWPLLFAPVQPYRQIRRCWLKRRGVMHPLHRHGCNLLAGTWVIRFLISCGSRIYSCACMCSVLQIPSSSFDSADFFNTLEHCEIFSSTIPSGLKPEGPLQRLTVKGMQERYTTDLYLAREMLHLNVRSSLGIILVSSLVVW